MIYMPIHIKAYIPSTQHSVTILLQTRPGDVSLLNPERLCHFLTDQCQKG